MPSSIERFSGANAFLSNFYVQDQPFGWHNYRWWTVEAAFQAAKCRHLRDVRIIAHLPRDSPGDAKAHGRAARMRPFWNELKVGIMYELVRSKFLVDPELFTKLKNTGNVSLVEGNRWHDNFWGECICHNCQDMDGQNWLGRILMEVRREL